MKIQLNNLVSERSAECIDFTMMNVFFLNFIICACTHDIRYMNDDVRYFNTATVQGVQYFNNL